MNRKNRGRSTDNELTPQEEEDLLERILRHQAALEDGRVTRIYVMANPRKLMRLHEPVELAR